MIIPTCTRPDREGIPNPHNSNHKVPGFNLQQKMQCRHVYPKQNDPATQNALNQARSPMPMCHQTHNVIHPSNTSFKRKDEQSEDNDHHLVRFGPEMKRVGRRRVTKTKIRATEVYRCSDEMNPAHECCTLQERSVANYK
jgi:hypothetical protein